MSARPLWFAVLAFLLLSVGLPGASWAQTVGTTSSNATGVPMNNTLTFVGQSISVPSPGLQIQSFTVNLAANGSPTVTVRPEIYEVVSIVGNVVTVVNVPVWTGSTQVVNAVATPVTFTPGKAVDSTKQYVIGVARPTNGEGALVYTATANTYVTGIGVYGTTTPTDGMPDDLGFTVVFAPLVAAVPTLTEWAMILLGLALTGAAVATLYRRRLA